jgi:hypothetical protein
MPPQGGLAAACPARARRAPGARFRAPLMGKGISDFLWISFHFPIDFFDFPMDFLDL